MKKYLNFLMLALVAVFACVSFSSCSDDEDPNKGIGNYYFQLSRVETNCVDKNGFSLEEALYVEWMNANNADPEGKISIGRIDNETARNWFDQNISALLKEGNEAYRGKGILPENGYIRYIFKLGSDASYGGAVEYATIEVTNSGARLL